MDDEDGRQSSQASRAVINCGSNRPLPPQALTNWLSNCRSTRWTTNRAKNWSTNCAIHTQINRRPGRPWRWSGAPSRFDMCLTNTFVLTLRNGDSNG